MDPILIAEQILNSFTQTSDGYRARVGKVQIAKWREQLDQAAEASHRETATAAAIARAERERIRQLATRTQAVCRGDDGTSCYFAALIAEG
jgi:hypothetical protein